MLSKAFFYVIALGRLFAQRGGVRKSTRAAFLDSGGFSLADLLVSLAVLALVIGAAAELQISGGTMVGRGQNLAEALQAARAAMLMEDDLRLAGYGYPSSLTRVTTATATSITFWADITDASTALSATVNAGVTNLTVDATAGLRVGDTIYLINGNQSEDKTVSALGGGGTTMTISTATTTSYPQGTVVGRPRQITYSWAGGALSKDAGEGAGPQTIATALQSFQFGYFDANDAALSTPVSAASLPSIRRISVAATAQSTATQNRGTVVVNSDVRPRNL